MRGTWTAVAVLLAGFLGTIADLSAQEMVFPAADWEGATPGSQGIDPEKLAAAVNYLRKNSGRDGVQELVIIRNGRMIWKGAEIANVHGVWSCTKSFSSTVLGLLIDDGKCSLNSRAHEFLPELERSYPDVTLRGPGFYGFNWWTNGVGADGKRKWPGAPEETFAASGFNNNDLFVIPPWQMVVVRLGLDEGHVKITDEVYGTFLRMVGQAIDSGRR